MNRCTRGWVAAALLAGTVGQGAAPVRTHYDPAFYAPSEAVVTPHILWAKPYARGPVRALFLIHRHNQREVIELAQRLQLDYTVFCAEDPTKFGETGLGVDSSWKLVEGNSEEEMTADLRGKLQDDYDVFVVGNIRWDAFPLDCRYEILRKVKAGTGFVGCMPSGHDEYIDRILSHSEFRWSYANWSGAAEGVADFFGIGDFVGSVDTAVRHSGACAVRVVGREVKPGSREPPRGGYLVSPIKAEPNTTYHFSVWYRTADGGRAGVSLHPVPVGVETPASADWRQAQATWNSGTAPAFGVYLLNWAVGSVWYDDVRLTKGDDPTNLLPNPGFEDPGPPPAFLADAIPYAALPAFEHFADSAAFARGTFQTTTFGQGRVALLTGFQVPMPQALTPAPQGPLRTSQLDYDYYLAAGIRAILWGARKEPTVTLAAVAPKLVLARADLGRPTPLFDLACADTVKPHSLAYELTVRDRTNRVWLARSGNVTLADGRAQLAPALGTLPAGTYIADLRLFAADALRRNAIRPEAAVLNFGSLGLVVASPTAIANLVLAKTALERSEPIVGTVTVTSPQPGQHLGLEARDNLGRLLGVTVLEVAGAEVPFTLRTLPAASILARLEVSLLAGDGLVDIDRREASYSLTDFLPDPLDLRHVVWTSPGSDFVSPYVMREFQAHGVDTQYTNFSALVLEANLWHIPYATRFTDAKTDWYQPRPTRQKGDLVRDPCLTDPAYRATLTETLTKAAAQVQAYSSRDVSLGDECMFVSGNWDLCFSPTCQADFREWLRKEYDGDLARVNAEWGSSYATWEAVVPITLDEARQTGRLPQWVDHRRHMESVWAGIYQFSRDVIRRTIPGARVGYEGSDTEVGSFHANDYWLLAQAMEFNNIYYRDFLTGAVRDFAAPGMLLGAGWYGGYPNCRNEPFMRWFPWRALFKGSNSLWIWTGYGSAGAVMAFDLSLYPFYQVNCDEVNEIKAGPGKLLISARRQDDGIAVLWSPSSVHVAQLTDGFPPMDATLNALMRVIHDLGLECRVVSYQQLAEGKVLPADYRVLLLPGAQALSPAEVAAVRGFASAGGTVLADLRPAVRNEHGRPYPTAALDDLFGVKQDPQAFRGVTGDLVMPGSDLVVKGATADAGLALAGGQSAATVGNAPALVRKAAGQGQAVLLNLSVAGYEEAERAAAGQVDFGGWAAGAALRRLFADTLAAAGVRPAVTLTPALPQVEVSRFRAGSAEYVGLVQALPRNPTDYTNRVATWPGPVKARLALPHRAHVYDVRAGRYLGSTDALDVQVRSGVAHLYALLPYRVRGVTCRGPATVLPGQPVTLELAVNSGGEPAVTHVLRVEVTDAQGRPRPEYGANVLAPVGRGQATFHLALDDTPGRWSVRVRDVASGEADSAALRVNVP